MKNENYEEFVDKFKPKLTTDDCYTPAEIYDWVLKYVTKICELPEDVEVLRPFKPGGDYTQEEYTPRCVVIDNPPFSILAQICRFYEEKKVKYFLFAPHLTLFGSTVDATRIVAGVDITYHNGAVVKTSFISNMFGDSGIIVDPEYRIAIEAIQRTNVVKLPKYRYPENVLTVSRLDKIAKAGVPLNIPKSHLRRISSLESQRPAKKGLFGGGYLVSEVRAAEVRAAEVRAAEVRAAEVRAAEVRAAEVDRVGVVRIREADDLRFG